MINLKKIQELIGKKIKLLGKSGILKESNEDFIARVLDDLEKNHNHSWYQELYTRNKDNLSDIALKYRGREITYDEMFSTMRDYAKSLKKLGIEKGMEIPICMSNTPELVYLLGAISIIGAKANIFANNFDQQYITEIINDCDANVMFVEDGKYPKIAEAIRNSKVENIVVSSLRSSLLNDIDPYQGFDDIHGRMVDTIDEVCRDNSKCMSITDFYDLGKNYQGEIFSDCGLDDEFLITYTSGSTHSSRPKAIVHAVRSLITIGRCHDPEVQKTTSMKDFTIQAHIPTYSNTDIISSISDALMQGSKLALEPIYDKDFFLNSLIINQPTYVVATRSFWIQAAKEILGGRNVKLPNLLLAFAVGEPLEKNEEKFLNKALRKAKAAKNMIPLPVSPVTMSVAGGDCEHGGIFWLLFRSLQSKTPGYAFKDEPRGLNPFQMVEVAVLDSDGNHCLPNELGRLVANSPCNMKKYKNNPEATEEFFIKDADGKVWGDCNVYGYLDENGAIYMKGRIPEKGEEEIPNFVVADSILRDTKNILSCEVVKAECEGSDEPLFIAHVEMQPGKAKTISSILDTIVSADIRCTEMLGEEIADKVFFRVHSNQESFPLTSSGKRDFTALEDEGITEKCIKPVYRDGEFVITTPSQYSSTDAHKKLSK